MNIKGRRGTDKTNRNNSVCLLRAHQLQLGVGVVVGRGDATGGGGGGLGGGVGGRRRHGAELKDTTCCLVTVQGRSGGWGRAGRGCLSTSDIQGPLADIYQRIRGCENRIEN